MTTSSKVILTVTLLNVVLIVLLAFLPSISNAGNVWPKPVQENRGAQCGVLSPSGFSFLSSGQSSDILEDAFKRYYTYVFYAEKSVQHIRHSSLAQAIASPNYPSFSNPNETGIHAHEDPDFHRMWQEMVGVCEVSGVQVNLTTLEVNVRSDDETLGLNMNEHYELVIDFPNALLTANTIWGALHGLETFSQLVDYNQDAGVYTINSNNIYDYPRYSHRGVLLDTARHFEPLPLLKNLLESMTYSKLNVLHIHFTDDQSFPVYSDTFPLLTKAAYSPQHIFSHEDLRELVSYARQRGIRIIPEFDTPAHCGSWAVGYPEFLICGTTVGQGYPNPLNDFTYELIEGFFTEMTSIFVDDYINTGGDEIELDCWESNPDIQKWLEKRNATDAKVLLDYYEKKLVSIVKKIGKKNFIWEDMVEWTSPGAPGKDSIAIMWSIDDWEYGAQIAANYNQTMIVSGCFSADYDWQDAYSCEPTNFTVSSPDKYKLVVGGMTPQWGEGTDASNYLLEIWPRASSMAERLWSPANTTSADSGTFDRLIEHRCRYVRRGIPFLPLEVGYCPFEYTPDSLWED